MHIPDAYLSPSTDIAALAVMTPVWIVAARKTRAELTSKQVPLLSMGAAFCFAIQMLNIPALGGTTAHALGTVLLAILLGPWEAIFAISLTLSIQALFFGDGGIMALGANSFNMALVATLAGYGTYRLCLGGAPLGSVRSLVAAAVGSYLGTLTASFSAGLILGAQPLLAHDRLGHALYFPFGWSVSVPSMVSIHLLTAAPAEAMITVCALAYLWKSFPELVNRSARSAPSRNLRIGRVLAFVLVLTPIGLIAGGAAWGEWDPDTLKSLVGYVPAKAAEMKPLVPALLPDYGFGGTSQGLLMILGYLISAVAGALVIGLLIRSISRKKPSLRASPTILTAQASLPPWMTEDQISPAHLARKSGSWFAASAKQLDRLVGHMISLEDYTHRQGLLQRLPLFLRTAICVGLLANTLLWHGILQMALLMLISLGLGLASRLPLRLLLLRPFTGLLFFGLVLAIPLSLASVTPGPVAFEVAGMNFSRAGMSAAEILLLRIAACILITTIWTSTSSWSSTMTVLKRYRATELFANCAALSYRFLHIASVTLSEMVTARISRQAGALKKDQARTYAGVGSAILFAKSMAHTEETHAAMRSRGSECVPALQDRRAVLSRLWLAAGGMAILTALAIGVVHAF